MESIVILIELYSSSGGLHEACVANELLWIGTGWIFLGLSVNVKVGVKKVGISDFLAK